jgi:hypothetical protein
MCATCGCGKPNDQHGDSRHITMDQVQQAAKAANISPNDVAKNIMDSTRSMTGASAGSQQMGQSAANSGAQ